MKATVLLRVDQKVIDRLAYCRLTRRVCCSRRRSLREWELPLRLIKLEPLVVPKALERSRTADPFVHWILLDLNEPVMATACSPNGLYGPGEV